MPHLVLGAAAPAEIVRYTAVFFYAFECNFFVSKSELFTEGARRCVYGMGYGV